MPAISTSMEPVHHNSPVTIIKAGVKRGPINLREMWHYRELLFFLAWRDISVRYRQTILGVVWAIIQPLFSMVVFSLLFGGLARIPSGDVPYPIFSYVALLPWQYFSSTLSSISGSLVASSNLLSKVYFPRLVIPLSSALPGLVDFLVASVVLIGMMVVYRVTPTWNVIWLPFFLLLGLITALGAGLWLAALNVRYRDIRYIVPFMLQFWLYASPVVYPSNLVPEPWDIVYQVNPMTVVIDGFRWALLAADPPSAIMIAISCAGALAVLVSGMYFLRRLETTFADVV